MSAINAIAKELADELRDGIAWVIIWKIGRSWTWLRTQRTRQHNRRPGTSASPYSCRCLRPAHERRTV